LINRSRDIAFALDDEKRIRLGDVFEPEGTPNNLTATHSHIGANKMVSTETVTELLGWCTAINFGLLIVASIALALMRGSISRIHSKLFGLDEVDLSRAYFQYLAQYKIAIIVLNLVPYIALKVMA
jgi:hypothetical protein